MKIKLHTRSNLVQLAHDAPKSKVTPSSGVAVTSGMASPDPLFMAYSEREGDVVGLAVISEDMDKPSDKKVVAKPVVTPADDKHPVVEHVEVSPRLTIAGLTAAGELVDLSHVAKITCAASDSSIVHCAVKGMSFSVHSNPTICNTVDATVPVTVTVTWIDPMLMQRSVLGPLTKVNVPVHLHVVATETSTVLEIGRITDAT